MYSLRTLYRILFAVWLFLVLSLGCLVAYSTYPGENSGSILSLYLRHNTQASVPPLPEKKTEEPQPVPEREEEPKPSEWVPVSKGYTQGKGSLSKIDVRVLDNEDVEVLFATTSAPGGYRDFLPDNVDACSVDLMGSMGKGLHLDRRLERGIIKRVQIADHKQWLRISGIAREQSVRIAARVEYAQSLGLLRIVFSPESR